MINKIKRILVLSLFIIQCSIFNSLQAAAVDCSNGCKICDKISADGWTYGGYGRADKMVGTEAYCYLFYNPDDVWNECTISKPGYTLLNCNMTSLGEMTYWCARRSIECAPTHETNCWPVGPFIPYADCTAKQKECQVYYATMVPNASAKLDSIAASGECLKTGTTFVVPSSSSCGDGAFQLPNVCGINIGKSGDNNIGSFAYDCVNN